MSRACSRNRNQTSVAGGEWDEKRLGRQKGARQGMDCRTWARVWVLF